MSGKPAPRAWAKRPARPARRWRAATAPGQSVAVARCSRRGALRSGVGEQRRGGQRWLQPAAAACHALRASPRSARCTPGLASHCMSALPSSDDLVALGQRQVGAALHHAARGRRAGSAAPASARPSRQDHAEPRIGVGPHQPRVGQQRRAGVAARRAGGAGHRRGDMAGQADLVRDDVGARLHQQRVAAPQRVARADLVQGAAALAVRRALQQEAVAGRAQRVAGQRAARRRAARCAAPAGSS